MTPITPTSGAAPPRQPDPAMARASELETAFLAEMLAHAGLGEQTDSFAGGPGGDQFASFLRQEQARLMVEAGGIGLSEAIFRAMTGPAEEGDHVPAP